MLIDIYTPLFKKYDLNSFSYEKFKWPILMDNYVYFLKSPNLSCLIKDKQFKNLIRDYIENYFLPSKFISLPKIRSIYRFKEVENSIKKICEKIYSKVDKTQTRNPYYDDAQSIRKTISMVKNKFGIIPEDIILLFADESNWTTYDEIVEIASPYKEKIIFKAFDYSYALDDEIKNIRKRGDLNLKNLKNNHKIMINSHAAKRLIKTNKTITKLKYRLGDELQAVFLYGSVASGIARINSDTDAIIITKSGDLYERAGGEDLEIALLLEQRYKNNIIKCLEKRYESSIDIEMNLWKKQCNEIKKVCERIDPSLYWAMRNMIVDDIDLNAMEFTIGKRERACEEKNIYRITKNDKPGNQKLRLILAGPTITLLGDDIVSELKKESKKFIKIFNEEESFFEMLCGKNKKDEEKYVSPWMKAGVGMH